jgi:hypothetical protein
LRRARLEVLIVSAPEIAPSKYRQTRLLVIDADQPYASTTRGRCSLLPARSTHLNLRTRTDAHGSCFITKRTAWRSPSSSWAPGLPTGCYALRLPLAPGSPRAFARRPG